MTIWIYVTENQCYKLKTVWYMDMPLVWQCVNFSVNQQYDLKGRSLFRKYPRAIVEVNLIKISPLKLWVLIPLMVRCTKYNIIWSSLSMTCGRSVLFSGYYGFFYQLNWPPRYNWNIVESGIKHHNP
jgi:hypothetical protein